MKVGDLVKHKFSDEPWAPGYIGVVVYIETSGANRVKFFDIGRTQWVNSAWLDALNENR